MDGQTDRHGANQKSPPALSLVDYIKSEYQYGISKIKMSKVKVPIS